MEKYTIDAKWMSELVSGNHDAFAFLYAKYHRQLYYFALRLSKNQHEAEELVQSVFVTVWETRNKLDINKSFSAYLFSIARNRFYDMLRNHVIEENYTDYLLHQDNHTSDELEKQIEDNEINGIIHKLLQQLPERRREIFMLHRFENKTYKQIAEKLQISENTVDTQIRNVLNFLRQELPKKL